MSWITISIIAVALVAMGFIFGFTLGIILCVKIKSH